MERPARAKRSGAAARIALAIPAIVSWRVWPATVQWAMSPRAAIWGAHKAPVQSRPGTRTRLAFPPSRGDRPAGFGAGALGAGFRDEGSRLVVRPVAAFGRSAASRSLTRGSGNIFGRSDIFPPALRRFLAIPRKRCHVAGVTGAG